MKGASRGVCVICRQAPLDDLRAHQCASTLHKESSHLRGSLLIKEQTHERRFARRLRTSQGILPLTWAPPYENKKRHRNASLLSYIIMYVSNVSLRRHYPHQVVGRSVQPPLSRLTRQLPIYYPIL